MKPKLITKSKPVTKIKPAANALINYEEVKKYAGVFASIEEIADFFEIKDSKLKADKMFMAVYRKAYAESMLSLRESQVELAKSGNATIMNWLGKCILGQSEIIHGMLPAYDYSQMPAFFLKRIVDGEDPLKVINEYETAKQRISKAQRNN